MINACKTKKIVRGRIVGGSAHIGHQLRDKKFNSPEITRHTDIVIIGGGISGLSAARYLSQNGHDDFILLDLEEKPGGNAAYGSNAVSPYPWGAHYIPIPNNSLHEYQQFLTEAGVIIGRNEQGLPVYNDYYLCFDPQDRLYINGQWQDGIIPILGVPEKDRKQIDRFLQFMNELRYTKGDDGKDAFALPVDDSSKDEQYTKLDSLTMSEWLKTNSYDSKYLNWYINYCTRDDFGTSINEISAWAAIHYFASRKGKGSNAEHDDVLTWPAGNGWLVQQLEKTLSGKVLTGSMAVKVKALENGNIAIEYLDVKEGKLKRLISKQCILAIPQFVASRILDDQERQQVVRNGLKYMPWMVANLTVHKLEERNGAPPSWDNVLFESDSLGYVIATHENLDQYKPKKNLTYYLPLTANPEAESRKIAQGRTYEEWLEIIFNDLGKVHPNIREATEEVNIMIWGHAMAKPLPGLIHGSLRPKLKASINQNIHFAHTDIAGVSLFEEAFYQGLNAAKEVIKQLNQS